VNPCTNVIPEIFFSSTKISRGPTNMSILPVHFKNSLLYSACTDKELAGVPIFIQKKGVGVVFQKQLVMRRVLYALLPLFLFSTYLYGPRVPLIVSTVFAAGILTEYVFEKYRKKKVSEAVLVTCGIFALALPPTIPLWTAVIGIVFAVAVGKGVYGGFGRNIFNPAITGRLFLWLTFPTIMMTGWVEPGGFGAAIDAVGAATPMGLLRSGETPELLNLFLGFRAGSMGESSILLILMAAGYMIYTKTANWKLMLSTFLTAGLITTVFYYTGIDTDLAPQYALMSGSLMYVTVFMTTDPVSAPNKPEAQWIYGVIIGTVTVLVRTFTNFPEGTSFGLMVGNTFASFLDEMVGGVKAYRKAKGAKS
jgi:Na+-transporting NADH:ubiquinone oxidoreductase subunit B